MIMRLSDYSRLFVRVVDFVGFVGFVLCVIAPNFACWQIPKQAQQTKFAKQARAIKTDGE